jgi:hypothetical protein
MSETLVNSKKTFAIYPRQPQPVKKIGTDAVSLFNGQSFFSA